MKINNKILGIFAILILPVLAIPPWIFPPDWGKTIIFRCIFSIVLFLVFYDLFYKKGHKLSDFFKRYDFKKNIIFLLLIAFATLYFLSSLFSKDILFSFLGSPYRGGGSLNFIFYVAFSLVVFLIFREKDWQMSWKLSIFIGDLVSLIAIFQQYGLLRNIFIPFDGRPPSVMGGPIFLGTYLLLLSFITLSFAIKEFYADRDKQNKKLKIFYIVSLILFLYVIILTGSRAAYFGLLAGFFYFFFFYYKKLPSSKRSLVFVLSKILALVIIVISVFGVYYMNYGDRESKFFTNLEKNETLYKFFLNLNSNKTIKGIASRLSIRSVLTDPRFSAWQVGFNSIKENPILGWGPENFSIAFDKYYNPALPQLNKEWGGWWDRAHNILLDIAVSTGIPALMIYLSIFFALFWQLQKNKYRQEHQESQIIFHGIQATLIAYIADDFFTFDTFPSYIIFFLLIAYSLYLINKNQPIEENVRIKNQTLNNPKRKTAAIILAFIFLLFLWQYNIKPFLINVQINMAEYQIDNKKCAPAFQRMEKLLTQHSFLDSYLKLQYVSFIQKCNAINPENSIAYAQKGTELLQESVKIRPLYSRSWIFLGSFTTIIANSETDPAKKNALLNEAELYFNKASELAPNHQETVIEEAKLEMVRGNYRAMKEKAEECFSLDPSLADCYWIRALSEIYLKDFDNAQSDINTAYGKHFDTGSVLALHQLANAYAASNNYKELALTYKKLIALSPNVAQYHSSLAFTYAQMKEYKKAKEEAMIFLQLMPEAKEEVDAFVKTLPY